MLSPHIRHPQFARTLAPTVRLLAALCLCAFAAAPALGQAEYSDAYSIDDSQEMYDPNTDSVYITGNAPPPLLVGVGVTEDSYESMTYSTSTYTTISSPDGRTVSGYSDGYIYAQAEAVALDVDPRTAVEGDYSVNSQHTYYREERDPTGDCYTKVCPMARNDAAPGALFLKASLGRFAPPLYYVIHYTYFIFFIRPVAVAYKWANTNLGCSADPNRPWAYLLACPNTPAPCNRPRVCAGGAGAYVQGFGLRINYWPWTIVCHVRFYYYAPMPWCNP